MTLNEAFEHISKDNSAEEFLKKTDEYAETVLKSTKFRTLVLTCLAQGNGPVESMLAAFVVGIVVGKLWAENNCLENMMGGKK